MGVTTELATAVRHWATEGLPDGVTAEVTRTLVNGVGVAVGAARYPEVDALVDAALASGVRSRDCRIPGRAERVDPLSAAVITGTAAHIDDFDDTHLATVVHPGTPVLASALPMLGRVRVTGRRWVDAVGLGMEVEIRVAAAMTPWHYDAGWHITSTVGPVGAAVTAGVLLDLDEVALADAINAAATMVIGHREGFGTTAKSFHPGKAAANGLLAATLAAAGLTPPPAPLEAVGGYLDVLSDPNVADVVSADFGSRWEVSDNTYKPYPCGVVSHPAIEAAEELHGELAGREVAAVRLYCHPLVVELAGNPMPATGLAARFSAEHGVAVALLDGAAGLVQFTDERVGGSDVAALRSVVTLCPDESIPRKSAVLEVDTVDGGRLRRVVDVVRGSLERPLTDEQMDAKAKGLIEATLPGQGEWLVQAIRGLPGADSTEVFSQAMCIGGAS